MRSWNSEWPGCCRIIFWIDNKDLYSLTDADLRAEEPPRVEICRRGRETDEDCLRDAGKYLYGKVPERSNHPTVVDWFCDNRRDQNGHQVVGTTMAYVQFIARCKRRRILGVVIEHQFRAIRTS